MTDRDRPKGWTSGLGPTCSSWEEAEQSGVTVSLGIKRGEGDGLISVCFSPPNPF